MDKTKAWMIIVFIFLPIMYIFLSYWLKSVFLTLLSIYGIIVLVRLFFQIFYAWINSNNPQYKTKSVYYPSISVVVPTYNESYKELKECLWSIAKQYYLNKFNIYLIDDGTKNGISNQVYKEFKEKFKHIELFFHHFSENQGKRVAQKWAFDRIENEIIVTVDSDTVLNHDALYEISHPFYDRKVGATTGNVRAKNKNYNLLTKLIDLRYWMAFNQERASQSLFGVVMCVSGVLGGYRTSIIKEVKEQYVNQMFMGKRCHFGDDRHLSNLVLKAGYNIYYTPKAKVFTNVPYKIKTWIKQQLRWNKSFQREIKWNLPSIPKHPVYMGMELFFQAFLPFFLILNLIIFIFKSITINYGYLLLYFLIITIISLIKIMSAVAETKDASFILFPIYSLLHVFILVPLRIVALATLGYSGWGTR